MSMSGGIGYVINAWSVGAVLEYCSPGQSPRTCASEPAVEVSGQVFGRHYVSAEFAGMFALWRFLRMKETRKRWRSAQRREKALRRIDAIGRGHAVRLRREIGPGPVIVYCDEYHDPCGGPREWQVTDAADLVPYRHRPMAGCVIDHELGDEWAYEYRPAGKYIIGSLLGQSDCWFGNQALPWELVMAFNDLHREWAAAAWNGEAHCEAFDWEAFHVKGLALARRLKQVLGPACMVIYMRPYEEPRKEEEGERVLEVRMDGTTREYRHSPYWCGSERGLMT